MQDYMPGTEVSVRFLLASDTGKPLAPVSIRYRILDEVDTAVLSWTAAAVPSSQNLVILIGASLTTLVAPTVRAIRTVCVEVTTAAGVIAMEDSVMIRGASALVAGVNSFQTFGQATLRAEDFTYDQVPGWVASDRSLQERALIQAFERILKLPIRAYPPLTESLPLDLAKLDQDMLVDLRSAQLVEANEILESDPVKRARLDGVTSIKVGESKHEFRAISAVDLPVSKKSLAYLQRWMRISMVIGRS